MLEIGKQQYKSDKYTKSDALRGKSYQIDNTDFMSSWFTEMVVHTFSRGNTFSHLAVIV